MKKVLLGLVVIGLIAFGGYSYLSKERPSEIVKDLEGTMPAGEFVDNDLIGGDAEAGDREEMEKIEAQKMQEAKEAMEKSAENPTQQAPTEKEESPKQAMKETGPLYTDFTSSVIGNGKTSLLFFHASWCPSCRQSDKDLAAIYAKGNATISTYKVDYDSSVDLKKRYGVVYQHTFVLIDGQGKALKTLQGASSAQLEELVKS